MTQLALLEKADPGRPILWSEGRSMSVGELIARAERFAERLPGDAAALVNLCERRDHFLIAYCAALLERCTTLLPASRVVEAIDEVVAQHPGSVRCTDDDLAAVCAGPVPAGSRDPRTLRVPGDYIAQIAFTSGTTGRPQPHPKRWGALTHGTRINAERIRECFSAPQRAATPWVVATVPPQHMYGIETSVLLPLLADMAVHASRPLFPADVARSLAEVPAPRVLVTTPVHLRALVDSGQPFPAVAVTVSATAPLDAGLAAQAESALGTVMLEMFGSTETCVIASRRTAHEDSWLLYPGVRLEPGAERALVAAPWFDAPTHLQDLIELTGADRFRVRGRNLDMVEVAGKRASLADLTRRLLAVPGVADAVVFQPDAAPGAVRRIAALVVAPGLTPEGICAHLSRSVDAAFMPRPLLLVPALPRNELGKLARARLMAELEREGASR